MQIFIKTPSGGTIAIEVTPSVSTLATVKQILNQKGIDTTDVYFEITSGQGIRKYWSSGDHYTLDLLGVANQMTILMGLNNTQQNQQANLIGNQQNPLNRNNSPPPSFKQDQQPQNQYSNQMYQTSNNQPPQGPSFISPQPNTPQVQQQQAKQFNPTAQSNPPQPFNPLQVNNPPPPFNPQQHLSTSSQFNPQQSQQKFQQPLNSQFPPGQFVPSQQSFQNNPDVSMQPQFGQPNQSLQGQYHQVSNQSLQFPHQTLPQSNFTVQTDTIRLKQQINDLEQELQTLRNKSDTSKLNESLLKLEHQAQQIDRKDETIKELEEQIRKLRFELDTLRREQRKERSKLNDIIEQLEDDKQQKQMQLQLQQRDMGNGAYQVRNTQREYEMEAQIQQLTLKNNYLNEENKKLKFGSMTTEEQQIQNKELLTKIEQLEKSVEAEHTSFVKELDNSALLKQKIKNLEKDIQIKEASMNTQELLLKNKNREITDLKRKLQVREEDLQFANECFEHFKGQVKDMYGRNSYNTNQPIMNQSIMNIFQQTEFNLKFQQESRQQREQQRIYEEEQLKIQIQEDRLRKERENDIIFQKTIQERAKLQLSLKQKFKDSHGNMDVCFIVDATGSMDSYKEQTMKCIQGSIQSIKKATNRNASWACVAYQDFAELKELRSYHQIDITPDSAQVEKFLKDLECDGGDDAAEDIRGGIKQACKLNWKQKFRMAILICDAPTHGKLYNGGVYDEHPNEDIRDAIELLIQNEILLIGINFTKYTEQMFIQIQKIFEQHKKQELFLQSNMAGMAHGNVADELVKLIQQASVISTKTNDKASFSNKKQDANKPPPTKDGAMEALCKKPNLFNFDTEPGVEVVKATLIVHKVDMKEQAFNNNIQTIQKIRVPEDYVVTNEGKWNCIRTKKPFAFGMMKEVYLMKKQNDTENHLYVIKMPLGGKLYPSMNDAIMECRSHLISKSLMRKFNRDIQDANEKKGIDKRYPEIQYSDFLILEEGPNQFWIAERFFKGEFVKYNNNYGYIDDVGTEMNKLAQAFSYYTYWSSNFNYMINDVQGVGLYFTDPAINTAEGKYDDTDMGQDGQAMYMVAFDGKKNICKEILQILDIEV